LAFSATILFPISFLVPGSKLVMRDFVDVLMDELVYGCEYDEVSGLIGGFGNFHDLVSGFVEGSLFFIFIFLKQLISLS
jgi:hypothetical protein